jgi:phenylpropionate dioxygenase-like ring-hydroxylating dioxygenase large terminal subunit
MAIHPRERRCMFTGSGPLPHILPPRAYWCPQHLSLEKTNLLEQAWHLVGTTRQLASPGDFITLDLLGVPLQVRNFDGSLRALSNVCAHRHCLIRSEPRGHSASMKCQYHGWEYGPSGKTRTIPQPRNFVPAPRPRPCLQTYRLQTLGKLVFVCLRSEGPDLEQHLGSLFEICQGRFGRGWEPFLDWERDYEANWKIPVENSLEAYHVPTVHPGTFKEDPGEKRSLHLIEPNFTAFQTELPFARRTSDLALLKGDCWLIRRLGGKVSAQYWQHHLFPNLLFSFTDTTSFVQCILPTGSTRSRCIVRQFGPVPGNASALERRMARAWHSMKAKITAQILAEDMALFGAVQKGMEGSAQPGILGRCEERVHAFQAYVKSLLPKEA